MLALLFSCDHSMKSVAHISPVQHVLESGEGSGLLARCWRPANTARAALAVVPGSHADASCYPRFAEAVASSGIAVYALARAGSHSDVGALAAMILAREPALPLYLLGHGSGAVSACLSAADDSRGLSGLICAGITLDGSLSRAPHWMLRVLGTFTARLKTARRLQAAIPRLSLPLLVLQGSADTVAPPPGSEYLHEFAGSRDKTLQIFEGYYHDLINDQGHDQVIRRINSWIEERLGTADQGTRIGIAYINDES